MFSSAGVGGKSTHRPSLSSLNEEMFCTRQTQPEVAGSVPAEHVAYTQRPRLSGQVLDAPDSDHVAIDIRPSTHRVGDKAQQRVEWVRRLLADGDGQCSDADDARAHRVAVVLGQERFADLTYERLAGMKQTALRREQVRSHVVHVLGNFSSLGLGNLGALVLGLAACEPVLACMIVNVVISVGGGYADGWFGKGAMGPGRYTARSDADQPSATGCKISDGINDAAWMFFPAGRVAIDALAHTLPPWANSLLRVFIADPTSAVATSLVHEAVRSGGRLDHVWLDAGDEVLPKGQQTAEWTTRTERLVHALGALSEGNVTATRNYLAKAATGFTTARGEPGQATYTLGLARSTAALALTLPLALARTPQEARTGLRVIDVGLTGGWGILNRGIAILLARLRTQADASPGPSMTRPASETRDGVSSSRSLAVGSESSSRDLPPLPMGYELA